MFQLHDRITNYMGGAVIGEFVFGIDIGQEEKKKKRS
jgi:hypothetical protein